MRALLASRRLLPEREARGQVQGAIRGRGALETWSLPRAWVRTRSPPLALALGGHSRFSFNSSFAASPVCCDVTLDERGGTLAAAACFLFCCSKRPMRLATL